MIRSFKVALFQTLWIERTTYKIASVLPGILRWFEVVQTESIHVSPIQHACETVKAKNEELRNLIADPEPVLKLTQSLQGVIDAAVNGGLAKYQEAFFRSPFTEHNADNVNQLQSLMSEQLNILETALSLHKKLASQDLLPLHSHLVERFATMKNSFAMSKVVSSKIVNTPLPPVPTTTPPSTASTPPPISTPKTPDSAINDGIYSKPTESNLMSTSAYNYVWSSNLDNYSPPPPRPPSIRMKAYNEMTNHHHHYHHHHRDSGIHATSIGSSEDVSAPPLPPRSTCKSQLSA